MSDAGRYEVRYERQIVKDFRKLDKPIADRIQRGIDALSVDPRPASSTPMVGDPGLRRLRVGDYRVLYTIEDDELIVLALRVGHRRDVYRGL